MYVQGKDTAIEAKNTVMFLSVMFEQYFSGANMAIFIIQKCKIEVFFI